MDVFVLAHNIRSLLNMGSIFRTADAFGISKIYLTGYTGRPDHPISGLKLAKTALGAEKYLPWEYNKSAVRVLKKLRLQHPNLKVVGLENNVPEGMGFARPVMLNKFKPTFPLILILGEEVKGINKNLLKLCDYIVEIPMQGQKESLNVSVAFGVAAFEITGNKLK